jgi:hypothetical protein
MVRFGRLWRRFEDDLPKRRIPVIRVDNPLRQTIQAFRAHCRKPALSPHARA